MSKSTCLLYCMKQPRIFFFSKKLSKDGKVSCSSCHQPGNAYQDGFERSLSRSKMLSRNTLTLLNTKFYENYFWDGRSHNLYEQVKQPLYGRNELGNDIESIKKMIKNENLLDSISSYFISDTCDIEKFVTFSLVHYISTISTSETKFSLYQKGIVTLTKDEIDGYKLFKGKAGCFKCHSGHYFTDNSFHDDGLVKRQIIIETIINNQGDSFALGHDYGRGNLFSKSENHFFRTPSLMNVAITSPYMHNGIYSNLEEVIDFYNRGGDSPRTKPLNLTDIEKHKLISFLHTLTDIRYQNHNHMDNTKKIRAVVKQNGVVSQEQDYIIEENLPHIVITEIGRFISDPNSEPLCVITVDEGGYKKIHISFKSNRLNTSLDIERVEVGKYAVKFNGQKKSELDFAKDEPVLFDGPNPMFDYLNVVEILKMMPSDTKTKKVNIIDWTSGENESMMFTFKRNDNKVEIDKGDENFNSSFFLNKITFIENYMTKSEFYEFFQSK